MNLFSLVRSRENGAVNEDFGLVSVDRQGPLRPDFIDYPIGKGLEQDELLEKKL